MRRCRYILWIGVALAACAPAAPRLVTAEDILAALQEAGATLAETELIAHPSLEAVGRVWQVNESLIQITEYESVAARQAVSDRLSPDGLALGGVPLLWSDRPHLWAIGRVIVAYEGLDGPTILLLSGLLGDPLTGQAAAEGPYPPAVTAAIAALAGDLAVDPATIEVVAFEEVEWPDACLGAAQAGETCAGVVTPGWRVTLLAGDEAIELHTDQVGAVVRRP